MIDALKLYSKQQDARKRKRGGYQYKTIPAPLRVQIENIFRRMLGDVEFLNDALANMVYKEATRVLCHEYGARCLVAFDRNDATRIIDKSAELLTFFHAAGTPHCLDVVQVLLTVARKYDPQEHRRMPQPELTIDEAVQEVNSRFLEHRVGFQIEDDQIVRIDSEFTHQAATVPALRLLREPYLAGAHEEFLAAHEHLRHGRFKECLNECLKAFESTMKAICHKRNWPYNQKDTATDLIKICEEHQLVPVFLNTHLTGLRTVLQSGVPTARNKMSAHGQGATSIVVTEDFASYILNLTASNILLLANSEKRLA